MAVGTFIFPAKAKLNFFNATGILGANVANFKLALVKSTWTPDDGASGDELWGDISANEIATAGQTAYSAGGVALTGVSLALSGTDVKFTFTGPSSPTWTADGTGIPAWRYGVIYYSGTLNGKLNPLVGHFLGDTTPADISATTSGNTLSITANASGVLVAS